MWGFKRLGLLAALVLVGIAPAAAAQAAVQPSQQDTQYLQAIHQVNLFEIGKGELAGQKAQDQGVKDLGQQIGTDHTQLDETVQQVASQLGVELTSELTADQQDATDQMNNASGEEFDQLWVTSNLTGHVQAIQATQTEISQGSDSSVIELAQTALPTLQTHYDELVELANQMGVQVPQSTGTATPSPGMTTPGPGTTESPAPGSTTESPAPGGGTGTETPAPGNS
ncbi:DUF4142 domain-containing protein [Salinispora mooreana]|uniref:DUF4142 domain-containing protein n=1 Tax=Salinispora mooreana TaxID=999545 RepID=UPI0003821E13|nr:DUF4142 domain-containing protein [Salinispora mooreana]